MAGISPRHIANIFKVPSMKKHRYKWFVMENGDRVQIDKEIAPLMQQVWDMGLCTNNSCQDNFGYVWIGFGEATDASAFLSVIAQRGDDELRYRANNTFNVCPRDAADRLPNQYHTFPDMWLTSALSYEIEGGGVGINIGIRFPRGHLARVMAALDGSVDGSQIAPDGE
jgi:hypothetical protein